MKRKVLTCLLAISVLLAGCTTTQPIKTTIGADSAYALSEVVKLAAQTIDANLFAGLDLKALLPQEAQLFSTINGIPLFDDHLATWRNQVLSAFRQCVVELPGLVEQSADEIEWTNGDAIVSAGNRSASTYLVAESGGRLEAQLKSRLQTALLPSSITWNLILDRYGIWQRGTSLWGRESLPVIQIDPFDHLFQLFTSTYLSELGLQEERLRTTPVPKGSGSFLEIFQQDEM